MDWKRLGKALLFPHIAVLLLLLPTATVLLIYSMTVLGTEAVLSYISYLIAFYTLTVWCARVPELIKIFKHFKNENKYLKIWLSDERLRINVSLYTSLIWNVLYGLFHIFLGIYHKTFWFYSLGAYYICLVFMRFGLLRHTRKYTPGEKMHTELLKYRATGWVFLLMNLALSVIIFFMVYFNRTFNHHMIAAIAMAAYTFTSFTVATVNIVKYRKYQSPVYSASKAINLAAASVSIITLEATMLTAFGGDTMDALTQKILLGLTGAAVSLFIIAMAIGMIVSSTKKLKEQVQNGK